MPFKTVHGDIYYYRQYRSGGRVVSKYVGPAHDEFVQFAMMLDELKRADDAEVRQAEQELESEYRRQTECSDREVEEYRVSVNAIVAAALESAGYWRSQRHQWRRKRRPRVDATGRERAGHAGRGDDE